MSALMLSPKVQRMQRSIRINEGQLLGLAEKARYDSRLAGVLHKRCADSNKWLLRWFRLYQNLLFYYDNEQSLKPIGVIFLEGCFCERVLNPGTAVEKSDQNKLCSEKMYCFAIMYRRENQRQYELRADTASECKAWIDGIKLASFNKLNLQMEELEQKHLHLLQVVESEKTAKWQYTQHCEELTEEIKKLRTELFALKKEWRLLPQVSRTTNASQDRGDTSEDEDDPDIAKIKKVQSFFRGWLCRRRWKQIVDEYIRSPHAESMRKRNCLVFRMVEAEEEYVEQLEILISCFLRPFKMAASSKNPPCTHEDINSIFLNSETVLFLHQIFLKGLTARMESWPTLVLGDLFDMLLPMLSIYQEYVRNHHYCLQVLTECKQSTMFASLLGRLERKPACKGRSLETFLTYPMHQIPRYIITLHELLAHTPPDHVEKKSLEHARIQLEDLSRQMHDEVSETENIRKNLAIERMIVEGCDILLDVNQMFVRQGTLVQILPAGHKTGKNRLNLGREREREAVRQCFLFSNHLIITSRTQGGKLHLVEGVGKIPLADITLIEDPTEESDRPDDQESPTSSRSGSLSDDLSSESNVSLSKMEHRSLDFKLLLDEVKSGQQVTIHLVAPSRQEKAAWLTDIAQCMDNVHFNGLFYNTMPNASSSTLPQCVKSDPNLFKDDVDIRFSKTFNTCKIPQIRYATPERLLQRLTDLRFLNIDFLNTFLLTYRVFTDGITVLEALKTVFFQPEPPDSPSSSNGSVENINREMNETCANAANVAQCANEGLVATIEGRRRISSCSGYSTATVRQEFDTFAMHNDVSAENGMSHAIERLGGVGRMGNASPRRISGASSISGYYSDDKDGAGKYAQADSFLGAHKSQHWRYSFRKYEEEQRENAAIAAANNLGVFDMSRGVGERGPAGGPLLHHNTRNSIISLQAPLPGSQQRSGSHDMGQSRSGSIASSTVNWRKGSVTIPEKSEDGEEEDETTNCSVAVRIDDGRPRRLSESTPVKSAISLNTRNRRLSAMGASDSMEDNNFLTVPQTVTASSSAETLTDNTLTAPSTPTNISVQLLPVKNTNPTNPSGNPSGIQKDTNYTIRSPMRKKSSELSSMPPYSDEPQVLPSKKKTSFNGQLPVTNTTGGGPATSSSSAAGGAFKGRNRSTSTFSTASSASACYNFHHLNPDTLDDGSDLPMACQTSISQPCSHHASFSGPSSSSRNIFGGLSFKDLAAGIKSPTRDTKRRGKGLFQNTKDADAGTSTQSGSSPLTSPQHKVGVVITSSRQAHRSPGKKEHSSRKEETKKDQKAKTKNKEQDSKFPATDGVNLEYFLSELSDDDNSSWSSSASAAVAFAVATAGSSNPPDLGPPNRKGDNFKDAAKRKCSITSNVSTLRVLSVLRHWVTKHSQDFEANHKLKHMTIDFLEDIICTPTLLPSEHRASSQLLRMLTKDEPGTQSKINLDDLLRPIQVPSKENISTLSALEVAEQITYLDQKIMFTIMSSEFLEQAWLKSDKSDRSPHIVIMTKRFNDTSRLVVSEILTQPCVTTRVQAIEKWAAVADICRCLHNFNGVLQICAAFTNSAVFRLKNTWARVSKSARQSVEKLQSLVSSDGRFRNLRDSLHRTDPPCIPYLGMYLSDLTFIEEGTPNFTDNGLLNFAKMRMIAHVIREIRQFQQTPYKIEPLPKVINYLLDPSRLLDDEDLYQKSLILEPRTSRLSNAYGHTLAVSAVASKHAAGAL